MAATGLHRDAALAALRDQHGGFDVIIIGGGATGAALALDAAARGYSTALLEARDFGSGTSTRSTKLIHGGVRYLEQLRLGLVFEALHERARLRRNAPHLVHERRFVVPVTGRVQALRYWLGLKLYDLLAGRGGFSRSRWRGPAQLARELPGLALAGLRGGVEYADGQFDDARLLISLLRSAAARGAVAVNHCPVDGIEHGADGRVAGVRCTDAETGEAFRVPGRVVINAAGPFSDAVAALAGDAAAPGIVPSQGAHIVLDAGFLPGTTALLMPDTPDGRIMFAIPWHGHVLVGTTDVPLTDISAEPRATAEEIELMLAVAGRHLARRPARADVRAHFAGIRPLAAPAGSHERTAAVSREHRIHVSAQGLVSITGGKWTTCRRMAEDCLDAAERAAGLAHRACRTADLALVDAPPPGAAGHGRFGDYGRDAATIAAMIAADPPAGEPLHAGSDLCAAEVRWLTRETMARTLEDLLARRARLLMLDTRLALAMAPAVAAIMAAELGRDAAWQRAEIDALAGRYLAA